MMKIQNSRFNKAELSVKPLPSIFMKLKPFGYKLLLTFMLLMPVGVSANNAYDFGNYIVYYNAFTADNLPAEMASAYDIVRSKSKGVLNISVQKKAAPGVMSVPVNATVTVWVKNLVGQEKGIDLRRVTEGKAIYYISEFRVSHKELITFYIDISPEGTTEELELKFTQQFYTN